MNSFLWNLIEVNATIVLLFLSYLFVRNKLTFRQRRRMLVGSPLIAVIVILVKSMIDFSMISYSMPIVELDPVFVGQDMSVIQSVDTSPFIGMNEMYILGVLGIGSLFLWRIFRLAFFFVRQPAVISGKYWIYNAEGRAPFSFFNRIQITPDLSVEEQEIVLEHEKMHADKWHSLDIMWIEICHMAFWFNPIFFLVKRELVNLHEFEVDAEMYEKHRVTYMEFLVNYALGSTTSNYLLTSRFYNRLTLKKRIKNMKVTKNKRSWMLGIIPLVAIVVSLVQCTKEVSNEEIVDGNNLNPERVEDNIEHYFSQMWMGEEPFMAYLFENTKYPEEAKENGLEGKVWVEMVVSKEGQIEGATYVEESSDIDEGAECLIEEALRVVLEGPLFPPTLVDGEPVRAKYGIPVNFSLGENGEEQIYEVAREN